jgi:hypothetical protein
MDIESLLVLVIFAGCCLVAISFSPIGRAVAGRIRGRPIEAEPDPAMLAEVDDLQARLVAMEERLDFAERALSAGPDAPSPKPEART